MNLAPATPSRSSRRRFLEQTALLASGALATLTGCRTPSKRAAETLFKVSLAEWSLHRALRDQKTITHLDFPIVAKRDYGIQAVEFVNQFFMDKARDRAYLSQLKARCETEGVRALLIMCDGEGRLGDPDSARQKKAVENHYKWVEAAQYLGCHSIRVNADAGNVGSFEDQQKRAADGLRSLSEFAGKRGLNVLVENHGGLSSHGAWLAGVMGLVSRPNCGTLPDFGNFRVGPDQEYDRYQGVKELMPYAKAVSAKSHEFDAQGNETHTDYTRMMSIVLHAGYRGYVGIEYEGDGLSEAEGIRATKRLLERVRTELASSFA